MYKQNMKIMNIEKSTGSLMLIAVVVVVEVDIFK